VRPLTFLIAAVITGACTPTASGPVEQAGPSPSLAASEATVVLSI
jgi:hypothetical protein